YSRDWNFRGTWQMNPKNKFNGYVDVGSTCTCTMVGAGVPGGSAGVSVTPEAVASNNYWPTYSYSLTWSSPWTSRLLLEEGVQRRREPWEGSPVDPTSLNLVPISDSAYIYHGRTTIVQGSFTAFNQRVPQVRAALSYVSGAHAFKVGMNGM